MLRRIELGAELSLLKMAELALGQRCLVRVQLKEV